MERSLNESKLKTILHDSDIMGIFLTSFSKLRFYVFQPASKKNYDNLLKLKKNKQSCHPLKSSHCLVNNYELILRCSLLEANRPLHCLLNDALKHSTSKIFSLPVPRDTAAMAIDFEFINLLDPMKEREVSEAISWTIQSRQFLIYDFPPACARGCPQ